MNEQPDGALDEQAINDEMASMFDLKKRKKKKKKADAEDGAKNEETAETILATSEAAGDEAAPSSAGKADPFELDPPSYSYSQLLQRVVDFLERNNPDFAERKRFTMKPPQLMRVGTKKTLWVNFQEICAMMRRSSDHVFQFMMAELGVEGSIDGAKRLVIRGKFVPKYIESLLRKYITEYVGCQMCRCFNTSLTKDSVSRLHFVACLECGSTRSVAPIRAGFHAQTRADRRALRNGAP